MALASLLLACGSPEAAPEPEPADPTEAVPAESTTSNARGAEPERDPTASCTLGESRSIGETRSRGRVFVDMDEDGGVVASGDTMWRMDETLTVTSPAPIRAPGPVLGLTRLAGAPLVISRSDEGLVASRVGAAASEARVVLAPRPGPRVRVATRAGARGALVVAHDGHTNPTAHWITDDGGRLVVTARVLGAPFDAEDNREVRLLGAAVSEGDWAALVRFGAGEDPDSAITLSTREGDTVYEALEDVAAVDALTRYEGRWWVLGSFEFSRPLGVGLLPGGAVHEPVEIDYRDSHPALEGLHPARLAEDGDELYLYRRTAAGDPLGRIRLTQRVARGGGAGVARDGLRYTVVYVDALDGDAPATPDAARWRLYATRVECAP